jgi:hypothetical protein
VSSGYTHSILYNRPEQCAQVTWFSPPQIPLLINLIGHVWSPWNEIETKALIEAINEYGVGQWAAILRDPIYGPLLKTRSNVDLKDKWRVLERQRQRTGQGSLLRPGALFKQPEARGRRRRTEAVRNDPIPVVATVIELEETGQAMESGALNLNSHVYDDLLQMKRAIERRV